MTIEITEYNPEWKLWYNEIKEKVWPVCCDLALGIEHVGSTAVPGLCAKPVIDISIICNGSFMSEMKRRLESIGYESVGDQGIPGREVFQSTDPLHPHKLYVCDMGSLALKNHLTVRNALWADEDLVKEYGDLKKHLVERVGDDRDAYCKGKTDFLVGVLAEAGLSQLELEQIKSVN